MNALRELRGDDFVALPNGRLRLMLHAKGRKERREVEPSVQAAEMLLDYIETFNREAVVEGSRERIAVGEAGPVWRGSWRGQWAYQGVAQTFERACVAAGAHAYRLHSLRRAFATDAESQLPRFVVARAGGWQGLDRLDNHYIRPRGQAIRRKLGWNEREDDPASDRERATGAVWPPGVWRGSESHSSPKPGPRLRDSAGPLHAAAASGGSQIPYGCEGGFAAEEPSTSHKQPAGPA